MPEPSTIRGRKRKRKQQQQINRHFQCIDRRLLLENIKPEIVSFTQNGYFLKQKKFVLHNYFFRLFVGLPNTECFQVYNHLRNHCCNWTYAYYFRIQIAVGVRKCWTCPRYIFNAFIFTIQDRWASTNTECGTRWWWWYAGCIRANMSGWWW